MRSFNAVENLLSEGKYYEAHQMLLSISQRQRKQKKHENASELLSLGGKRFVELGQYASAFDILETLLDILMEESDGIPKQDPSIWANKFVSIIEGIPELEIRDKSFPNPMPLCNKAAKYFDGQEGVFDCLGNMLYQKKEEFINAALSLLTRASIKHAVTLSKIALDMEDKGEKGEPILKIIASLLLLGKINHCHVCMDAYLAAVKKPFDETVKASDLQVRIYGGKPLLAFIQMTLLTARVSEAKYPEAKSKLFLDLYNRYASMVPLEEKNLLDSVAQKVFKLKIQAAPVNPLQAMLQGMLG